MVTSRPRGFTLLELLIAGAVGVVVAAATASVLVATDAMHRRQADDAELRRASTRILETLSLELRKAGHGWPRGTRTEGTLEAFPAGVVAARADALVFLADLPRPDSNLDGFSTLADDQATDAPAAGVALLNELTGNCDARTTTPYPCSTAVASLALPGTAGTGCEASGAAPTCPWGGTGTHPLKKYRSNERIVVADAAGRWVERTIGSDLFVDSGARRFLELDAALPGVLLQPGLRAFVSTPDRVHWRVTGGLVERMQCWGSVAGAPLATLLAADCTTDGTGWKGLWRGTARTALAFTYRDAAGTELTAPVATADLPRIARVDVTLRLERATPDGPHLHEATTSVALRR